MQVISPQNNEMVGDVSQTSAYLRVGSAAGIPEYGTDIMLCRSIGTGKAVCVRVTFASMDRVDLQAQLHVPGPQPDIKNNVLTGFLSFFVLLVKLMIDSIPVVRFG